MEISGEKIPLDFHELKPSAVQGAITQILKSKIIFVCLLSLRVFNSGEYERETSEQQPCLKRSCTF